MANERKNIRFEFRRMMIFGVSFLSLANRSAICDSKSEFWVKKGFTVIFYQITQIISFSSLLSTISAWSFPEPHFSSVSWTLCEILQLSGIFLGPKLIISDRVDTLGTFEGFRTAFGGFLRHFLAPVIKVIGNSFLILGLLWALFGHFFWHFWPFLHSWDPTTADSNLGFENWPAESRVIGKIAGTFWAKMSNHRFQRVTFKFFFNSLGLQFFYHFISNMSIITYKWPEIFKMVLWWPRWASESSNLVSDLALSTEIPWHIQCWFDNSEVQEKVGSDFVIFSWPFEDKLATRCWETHTLTQFEQARGGSLVRAQTIIKVSLCLYNTYNSTQKAGGQFISCQTHLQKN